MVLDSGVLDLRRGANTAPAGEAPVLEFETIWSGYYADRTVGITRWYTAQQHGDRPDIMVRIQRNYDISTATDRVNIWPYDHKDSNMYKIIQIQHVLDDDGLPVTDLTLERTGELDGST